MRKLIIGIVVVVVALGMWRMRGHAHARDAAPPADKDEVAVNNRIWIDHVPTSDRDVIQLFLTIDDDDDTAFGAFMSASQWLRTSELFFHAPRGNKLQIDYPQTGERDTVTATARRCKERDMEFCLELTGARRGVKRYYSRTGWEIEGLGDVDAKLKTLAN